MDVIKEKNGNFEKHWGGSTHIPLLLQFGQVVFGLTQVTFETFNHSDEETQPIGHTKNGVLGAALALGDNQFFKQMNNFVE